MSADRMCSRSSFHARVQHLEKEPFPALELVLNRSPRDAGAPSDVVGTGLVVALLHDALGGGLYDAGSRALAICSRSPSAAANLPAGELIVIGVTGTSWMANISSGRPLAGHRTLPPERVIPSGPLTECHIDHYYSLKRLRG